MARVDRTLLHPGCAGTRRVDTTTGVLPANWHLPAIATHVFGKTMVTAARRLVDSSPGGSPSPLSMLGIMEPPPRRLAVNYRPTENVTRVRSQPPHAIMREEATRR
jgi:hypothetical protein